MNDVRDAVLVTLQTAFPDIPVSDVELGEGEDPPYMYVKLAEVTHGQQFGRRYERTYMFDIHYYAVEQQQNEMYGVAEQAIGVLDTVLVGGRPLQCVGVRLELEDGVLHMLVDYRRHMMAARPVEPRMESLDVQGGLK